MDSVATSPAVDRSLLERRLSPERLGPYRLAAGGDLGAAIVLYEWNADLAAALWATLGYVEVVVRNAMHEQLTLWSATMFGEPRWYLDRPQALSKEARRDIAEARRFATANGRPETAGRVVAELSMGFWRYLLAARYERTLWLPCLRSAFPLLQGVGMRRDVHDSLARLQRLRNRIAHHEPVHNRPVWQLYRSALIVVGWICPETRQWIEVRSDIERLLATRPGGAAVAPIPRARTGKPQDPRRT